MTSHVMEDIQGVCDRVVMLSGGKVVVEGRIDELARQITGRSRYLLGVGPPNWNNGSSNTGTKFEEWEDNADRTPGRSND